MKTEKSVSCNPFFPETSLITCVSKKYLVEPLLSCSPSLPSSPHRLREFPFATKEKEKKTLNSWHVEKLYYYDKFRCPKCRQSKSVRNRAFTFTTTFRRLLSFQRKRLSTHSTVPCAKRTCE